MNFEDQAPNAPANGQSGQTFSPFHYVLTISHEWGDHPKLVVGYEGSSVREDVGLVE